MRTALHLLLAVAGAAVLAALIPQERTAAAVVARWRAGTDGPGTATTAVLDALGLLDVIGSWWFGTLAGLLLVSLVACLLARARVLLTAGRRPPPGGPDLERLGHVAVLRTGQDPEAALAAVAPVLRRRRFRVARRDVRGRPRLAAERVRAREVASLGFHVCILVLLAAVAVGQAWGFAGQVDLVEGEAFTETALAYDGTAAGPGWSTGDHRGFRLALTAFRMREHPDGTPIEQVAVVRVDDGSPREVAVNRPLRHDGMRVHVARWGLAPRVTVRDAATGEALADGAVRLAAAGPLAWRGLVVLPGGDPAAPVALDLVLLPEARVGPDGRPQAVGTGGMPVLLVDAFAGADVVRDDGARREVDRSRPPLGPTAVLTADTPGAVAGGRYEVSFAAPARWAGFQVSRVPGTPVLLAAAVGLLLALTVSLRAWPVRVWVEARPVPGGAEVVVAAVARARPEALEAAFPRLVAALARRLG